MRRIISVVTMALVLACAIPVVPGATDRFAPQPQEARWVARGPRIILFRRDDPNRPYLVYGITALAGLGVVVGLAKMCILFRRWQIDSQRDREPWEQKH